MRVEKCVGVWGSGLRRVLGQIGQVGSSCRGRLRAKGRQVVCDACIEQSRRGGCETEVSGRQTTRGIRVERLQTQVPG